MLIGVTARCSTIWYEIIACEFPHKHSAPQPMIWQVGSGIKQSLSALQTSKDVKVSALPRLKLPCVVCLCVQDLLMMCCFCVCRIC